MPRHIIAVTLRVTFEEEAAIRVGAEAMALTKSALMELAALCAAHKLGIYEDSGATPPPRPGAWDALPERGEEITSDRITVSLTPIALDLSRRTADWLGTSTSLFLVGSTLRYVANIQIHAEGRNHALARVTLPTQYSRLSTLRARKH